MLFESPSVSVVLVYVVASSACMAARPGVAPPRVPTVASIPVAPLARASDQPPPLRAPVPAAETRAEPTPPSSAAILDPAPAALAPPRVVLVDELPYRSTHGTARWRARGHDQDGFAEQGRKLGRGGRPYHPSPGIVVDVTQAQGGAAAAELQRTARSAGYWPFRRCYEEGLRRDQALSGRLSFELAVASTGAVEHASLGSATLRDESVVLCIGREAVHLALPSAESPTKAKMEVTLSTGDEPLVAPLPVAHADELRDALRASWPAVEQCYASELAKHPDAGGRMELRFRAKRSGEIVEVAEQGDPRFDDVDVTRCVLGVYRTARLPAARIRTAHQMSFAYAMHLESKP